MSGLKIPNCFWHRNSAKFLADSFSGSYEPLKNNSRVAAYDLRAIREFSVICDITLEIFKNIISV